MAIPIEIPKSDDALRKMSDADLERLRAHLAAEADQLRLVRKALALEAERRAHQPNQRG